ncbi:Tyrosinase [Colletotrichum spinosum]|uniref:tyrosinase n=1 Tax=Colletotrichum spinosum TaxID=1347390 RepID=A0A4R8QE15_9PEZI|nr:Tyrosinase [Colletotrichum spinosum]
MSEAPRIRPSLQVLCTDYFEGKVQPLENLIVAFRKIQALPASHDDSFFTIAGYHGEPFVQEDPDFKPDSKWWGGWCQHNTVLFPTWHRAYLLRLEEALRNALPDADIALPYWDQCDAVNEDRDPIPWILTAPVLPKPVEGDVSNDVSNPLYSYTLKASIADSHHDGDKDPKRYTKPEGYQTVRYPQSGLVGNDRDRAETEDHNTKYGDAAENAQHLNNNVKAWLRGTQVIDTSGGQNEIPLTTSLASRYRLCLEAEEYTAFSNNASNKARINHLASQGTKTFSVALEDGHNAMHLAVGGFFQLDKSNADPIRGANGDMGENETASFDPIFYFHHAFIDYLFWKWQQKHHFEERGSLTLLPDSQLLVLDDRHKPGDQAANGLHSLGGPDLPFGHTLTLDTPLKPFRSMTNGWHTSNSVTDIRALGYDYAPGSFDKTLHRAPLDDTQDLFALARVAGLDRVAYEGSFVIRTYAKIDGKKVEVGREAVLSRWSVNNCGNCRNHLDADAYVPITKDLSKAIGMDSEKDVASKLCVEIQSRNPGHGQDRKGTSPVIRPL